MIWLVGFPILALIFLLCFYEEFEFDFVFAFFIFEIFCFITDEFSFVRPPPLINY